MSKKITHERIKQIIIEDEPFRQDEMLLYVEQQEMLDEYLRISYDRDIKAYSEIRKLNKLLELYKKLSDIVIYKDEFYDVKPDDWIDYYELEKVIKQIKELENE